MTLQSIGMRRGSYYPRRDRNEEFPAWKIVKEIGGTLWPAYGPTTQRPYSTNRWMKARFEPIGRTLVHGDYKVGFHVYMTEEDAREEIKKFWGSAHIVVPVRVSGLLAKGFDKEYIGAPLGAQIHVYQYMKIDRDEVGRYTGIRVFQQPRKRPERYAG
jgi:hypothetical protein